MSTVVEPRTPEEFASALAESARTTRSTVIRGGGTKSGWGRPAPPPGLTVSTARLDQLIVHRHGDMTATVQAGMRLADFNRALAAHGQWLPVESAFADATIGGVLATNDCGPMRHRNGTPRDLVIGISLALTDGRLVKAGGHVVKNVAGYDLGRLVSGSFGALAGIVDVTVKLMPIPRASVTLVVEHAEVPAMARDAAALMASQLEPAAFDVRCGGRRQVAQLLIRFASSPASTSEQASHATALLTGSVKAVSGDEESALWAAQLGTPWAAGPVQSGAGPVPADRPTVLRASWLPAALADVVALVGEHALTGRVMGTGLIRLEGDPSTHPAFIERLRASAVLRHVVVLQAPDGLKRQVDAWGPPLSAVAALRALKQTFDPANILNQGRGPI